MNTEMMVIRFLLPYVCLGLVFLGVVWFYETYLQ
jgi:hypothetical protein